MGNNRDFSDSIKLEVIKSNLKKHGGSICCEICNARLNSIDECHFDHIFPFARGGKSSFENCQILCSQCNLRKNDKELEDFVLEEKAKKFLEGVQLNITHDENETNSETVKMMSSKTKSSRLTKEEFDAEIRRFIDKKGDIHKVDFTRSYNHLPSVWYVKEYYGDLNTLKKSFGIEDLSFNWTRERIKEVLIDYVVVHGDVSEKDLKKINGLPSYPCVMKHYSEYASFSFFKQEVLGIKNVYKVWTKEDIIEAGKAFVNEHGKLTEKDLKACNGLPTSKVIYNHFGSINGFQLAIGSPVSQANTFIDKETIEAAVDEYFGDNERVIDSRKAFFESFPIKAAIICKRYGSFESFCSEFGIKCLVVKKASYSKKDIDDVVHNWIFSGKDIPMGKELTSCGLPSMAAIMRYYENWKEPFVIYKRIFDEANRNKS